jgi:hypothetical protein
MLGKGIAVALAGCLGLAASCYASGGRSARFLALVPSAIVAGVLVLAQRGGEPGTHPHPKKLPPIVLGTTVAQTPWQHEDPRSGRAWLDLQTRRVEFERGKLRIAIEPLLTFESRSVDRGLTLFASPADRIGPPRSLVGFEHRLDMALADYGMAEPARFDVMAQPEAGAFAITAQVDLPEAVYSHLNSYTTVFLAGHERIELEFSPCRGKWIDPMPHEYPFGLPLRLGTMYHDGMFRVVQASNAEKGPFQTLAEGRIARGDPLAITVRDAGREVAVFTFEDWSSQASTDLSPTAGWGLPQNEILFARQDSNPASPVFIGLTLASTSTGRGFDSVGHAAGSYRNRIRVTWVSEGNSDRRPAR